ncbi:YceI family protein [Roseibium sp. FZY0029]|uniref:YceI family protein n=1 Tax=Roseibium sp. FZY0029 TaxID=3116647 RepID=UPI002ECC11F2|nr:YceI family protein [Roseibium sp. FZY0029]
MPRSPERRLLSAFCVGAAMLLSSLAAHAESPAADLPAGSYKLDKYHSTLVFRADHLGFSFYSASFADFDATLQIDPADPAKASVNVDISTASLHLTAPPQDGFRNMLLGPDWLNAGDHPTITYRSTGIELTGADTAVVSGDLTFRGKTRPVELNVRFNGGYTGLAVYDPQARIGFSATGTLRRSDFGMSYGLPPEGSNLGVGDEDEFVIEAEFNGPPLKDADTR